jgi:hypothetical protein
MEEDVKKYLKFMSKKQNPCQEACIFYEIGRDPSSSSPNGGRNSTILPGTIYCRRGPRKSY